MRDRTFLRSLLLRRAPLEADRLRAANHLLNPAEQPHLYVALGSAVGILAFAYVLTPLLSIRPWALGDAGGHLVLPYLLESNLAPNIDFAYTYGPATIALNYVWALLFGNHWRSFFILFALLQISLAVSLALIPYYLRLPRIFSVACVLAMLPFLRFEYSIGHLAEKIFLINAAIFIVSGRYSVALALCSASVLFRPSSGLLAGAFILIGLTYHYVRRQGLVGGIKSIATVSVPSACVMIIAGGLYGAWIGPKSFFLTVVPLSGSKLYGAPSITVPLRDLLPRFLPEGQRSRPATSAQTPAMRYWRRSVDYFSSASPTWHRKRPTIVPMLLVC